MQPQVMLVVEIILVKEFGDQKEMASGGFAILDLFGASSTVDRTSSKRAAADTAGRNLAAVVMSGSPRQIQFARSAQQQ